MIKPNNPIIYMPILKWKLAEMTALAQLADNVRSQILPLVEIQPPSVKRDSDGTEHPPKALTLHLQSVARDLATSWGLSAVIVVDLHALLSGPLEELGGQTAQDYLFSHLNRERVKAIPVVTDVSTPEALESCASLVQRDNRGACLRIDSFHWRKERTEAEFASLVTSILDRLGTRPELMDLLIDAGDLKETWKAAEFSCVKALLAALPRAQEWRNLAVASCGFPSTTSGLDEDSLHVLERYDWTFWRALLSEEGSFPRAPIFGDYGINHPSQGNATSSVPLPTVAQIRYTSDDAWVCIKGQLIGNRMRYGQLVKSGCGNGQFAALAKRLVLHAAFQGKEFSTGDGDIAAIAADHKSPEDPRGWRRIGTNHHITFVVRQLEKVDASSDTTGPIPGGLQG